MHEMYELKEMLCDELEKITKKGELSAGSLDAIDKLTHSIKSIETIMAMDGYSGDGVYMGGEQYARRNSYARGGRRGYSRDDEMDSLKSRLHELMEDTKNEEERKMIRHWMKQISE